MAWIKAKHEDDLPGIAARLYNSNIVLSDLDDTLAKSPMKKIVYGFLKRRDMLVNPKFIAWCLKAAWEKAIHGKKSESELSKDFAEAFLSGKEITTLEQKLAPDLVLESVFPGVMPLYSMLPDATKILVTRSIEAIAEPYRKLLGFDVTLESQYNKKNSVDFIIGMFPDLKQYAVFGDSEEDEEMADYLRFKLVKGDIDTLVSVYVAKSEKKASSVFDASIGRDYSALVELVKKYSIPFSSSQ